MGKRILVLNGSPERGGNTDILATALIRGAKEAGHSGVMLTVSDMNIAPFRGAQQAQDDMSIVLQELEHADVVVWASPVYWMQFPGQLKVIMDRMAFPQEGAPAVKESVLLACGAEPEQSILENLYMSYRTCFIGGMKWLDRGSVLAGGLASHGQAAGTVYEKQAYALGKTL